MNAAPAQVEPLERTPEGGTLNPGTRYAFTRNIELDTLNKREDKWPSQKSFSAGMSYQLFEVTQRQGAQRGTLENVYTFWGGDGDFFHILDRDGSFPSVLTVEKRGKNTPPTADRIAGEDVKFRVRDSIRDKLRVITDALGVTSELRQKAFGILREAKLKASQVAFQLAKPRTVLFGRGQRDRSPSANTFTVRERMDHEKVVGNEVQQTQTVTLETAGGAYQKITANSGVLEGYALDERDAGSSPAGMNVVRAADILSQSSPALAGVKNVPRKGDSDTTLCELVRVAVKKVQVAPEPPPPPPPATYDSRRDSGHH